MTEVEREVFPYPDPAQEVHGFDRAHPSTRLLRTAGALITAVSICLANTGDDVPMSQGAFLSAEAASTVSGIIDANTVLLPDIGCSGTLLRDTDGTPVGVETASHCELRSSLATWLGSGDGPEQDYLVKSHMIQVGPAGTPQYVHPIAQTGGDTKSLRTAGSITSFWLPPPGDMANDQAIGVLSGHTLTQAIHAYESEQLTQAEINQLTPGETVWWAGWPAEQHGDGHGNNIRERFAMTYIGQTNEMDPSGNVMNRVWLASRNNGNDASCTPGASGSGAFILQEVPDAYGGVTLKERLIGPLSVYVRPSEATIATLEQQYPQLKTESGPLFLCGFTTTPIPSTYEQVGVVPDVSDIPDPQITTEPEATEFFYDPSYLSRVVIGTAVVKMKQHTKDGTSVSVDIAIKNPVVFLNSNGSLMIGYDRGQDTLQTIFVTDPADVRFYKDDGDQLHIVDAQSWAYTLLPNGKIADRGFKSAKDLLFGVPLHNFIPGQEDPAYQAAIDHGKLAFTAQQH